MTRAEKLFENLNSDQLENIFEAFSDKILSLENEVTELILEKEWSSAVTHTKHPGTFPPNGTFTKNGKEIAKIMAKKSVSPHGLGSAVQMCQFFINRRGRSINPTTKANIQKAIKILQSKK